MLSKTNIIDLYKKMQLIRLYDEKIIKEYPKQQMRCPIHLSIGQEAISAGVLNAMKISDKVMSNHRAHGHYLSKGGNFFCENVNNLFTPTVRYFLVHSSFIACAT